VRLARNRTYRFTVMHTSGSIDWGMSLHRGDAAYRDKSSAIAAAWSSPAGQGETFEITAPAGCRPASTGCASTPRACASPGSSC
jgi:hypothetical protein